MAVNIDAVLESIGELGPYQRRIYFLLCIPILFVGAINLSFVFLAATPDYRCFVPGCDNDTHPKFQETFLNFTIPVRKDGHAFEKCIEYTRFENSSVDTCSSNVFSLKTNPCSDGVVFDQSIYESTLVTEFNLTCERELQVAAVQTIFFVGIMFGCFVMGIVADIIGRRLTILICIFVTSIFGFAQSFANDLVTFNILRFITGFASAGLFQTAFVLGVEFVGPSKRVMFGVIGQYFFALGEVMLGILAWGIRKWRVLQMVMSGPVFGFMLYVWVVPESVRWLQSKGKHAQVVAKLEEIAKENKKTIPLSLLQHEEPSDSDEEGDDLTVLLNNDQKVTMVDIFKSWKMTYRLSVMIFIWIVTTLVYYGLSYSAVSLASSSGPFVSFILNALVEIPGYTVAWFGMTNWGRKGTLFLSLLLSGIACAASGYMGIVPGGPLITFLIGKCSITAAFSIIYVFTAEMFPTTVRNTILGICSMFARLGGMAAPFSPIMKAIYPELPMLVFGGLALVAAACSVYLPETLNTRLPDSIRDAVDLGKIDSNNTSVECGEQSPLLSRHED